MTKVKNLRRLSDAAPLRLWADHVGVKEAARHRELAQLRYRAPTLVGRRVRGQGRDHFGAPEAFPLAAGAERSGCRRRKDGLAGRRHEAALPPAVG